MEEGNNPMLAILLWGGKKEVIEASSLLVRMFPVLQHLRLLPREAEDSDSQDNRAQLGLRRLHL